MIHSLNGENRISRWIREDEKKQKRKKCVYLPWFCLSCQSNFASLFLPSFGAISNFFSICSHILFTHVHIWFHLPWLNSFHTYIHNKVWTFLTGTIIKPDIKRPPVYIHLMCVCVCEQSTKFANFSSLHIGIQMAEFTKHNLLPLLIEHLSNFTHLLMLRLVRKSNDHMQYRILSVQSTLPYAHTILPMKIKSIEIVSCNLPILSIHYFSLGTPLFPLYSILQCTIIQTHQCLESLRSIHTVHMYTFLTALMDHHYN